MLWVALSLLAVVAAPSAARAAGSDTGVVLAGNEQGIREQIDSARRAGTPWVYLILDWTDYEPTPDANLAASGPGREAWDRLGADLAYANARGLKVMVSFKRTPSWARAGDDERAGPAPAYYPAYASFLGDVARVYGDFISAYGTWSEPNIDEFWAHPDPVAYAQVHRLAAAQIRMSDPSSIVVLGPFAGGAGNSFWFLTAVYREGVRGTANRVGWNAYPYGAPEAPRTTGGELGGLFRVARILRSNDPGRRIWLTELGWSTCECSLDDPNVVTPAEQSNYLLGGLSYVRRYLRGGVDRVFWYNMRDGADPKRWGSNQGLLREDLSPKPAYGALRRSQALLARPKARWARSSARGAVSVKGLRLTSRRGAIRVQARVGVPRRGQVQILGYWRGAWRVVSSGPIAGSGQLKATVEDAGYPALRVRARSSGSGWVSVQMPVPNGPVLRT